MTKNIHSGIDQKVINMKKFKEFLTGKGYISLSVTDDDCKKIFDILDGLNIKDYIKDLHLTLMYDKSNPKIDVDSQKKSYIAKINSFKTLGEPDSKWYAIALDLESPELNERHNELKKLGFAHSYPNFIAHISMKYKPTESDITILKDNLELFKKLGNIHLHNETMKRIEE